MKVCIIFIFCLLSINCFADDIRMATSENIDLFDKSLEKSEKLIKKNDQEDSDSTILNSGVNDSEVEGDDNIDKDEFKSIENNRENEINKQVEESARNKRKNIKRINP